MIATAARPDCDSEALGWLSRIFRNESTAGAVEALLAQLAGDHPANIRRAMVDALVARLEDAEENTNVRQAAALGKIDMRMDKAEGRIHHEEVDALRLFTARYQ